MELSVFVRFHAHPGQAETVAAAIAAVVPPTRAELGCLSIQGHRSIQDRDLFWIHSRWADEAAFDAHAAMPHTVVFVETVQAAIDHPFAVSRSRPMSV
jgi:quinol monooxygenase YgiN